MSKQGVDCKWNSPRLVLCWTGAGLLACVNDADSFLTPRDNSMGQQFIYVNLKQNNLSVREHYDRSAESELCRSCGICGQKFKNREAWIRHRWRHRDYSSFKHECIVCHSKFYRKDYLSRHIARVHPDLDMSHQTNSSWCSCQWFLFVENDKHPWLHQK